ncbi:MAG TPA: 2-polyprenyl-3-methyl-6-methoxy-1,4-benzoquinone monooxygenase [Gammaproteobacteria bacterium]|nr:2-polyprenyl-3-methyl-6-methoxy-1,4-benzoquinone monooxygenase [Gammaproteobacteria bacterium]
MNDSRTLSPLDRFITELDKALRTAFPTTSHTAARPNPAAAQLQDDLDTQERQLAGKLMRVNHAGEVAAQALYQGQAFTAHSDSVRSGMAQSAAEEVDHLGWCEQRLQELNTGASKLDPFWYLGSFAIGALAGIIGDNFSLGFVAETERQVVEHLDRHLQRLPAGDHKSRAILEQMKQDEARHSSIATHAGGSAMPEPIRNLMRLTSKIMTGTAYRI